MQDKISIVVPVYNVERYIRNTIEHIQNQTYSNLEIILVDDGTPDNSGVICDEYAAKDDRIRVIHKTNGGSSTARNAGIEAATGKYIGFLDADDTADETMYESLYKVITDKDALVVQCMSRDFDESGVMLKGPYKDSGQVTYLSREDNFRLLMLHEGDSSFCTKLIRTDFMKRFRFQENKLNEDFELVLKLLMNSEGFYSLEEAHYDILIRKGSNQRSGFNPILYEAVIDNSDLAYDLCKDSFPNLLTETERFRYYQRLMFLLHIPVGQMRKDNKYYYKVISEVRNNRKAWKDNPYLTRKERRNLWILSVCPVLSKRIFSVVMAIKKLIKKA